MRKIVSYLHASLDGFVEGEEAWDLSWAHYDAALEAYAKEILQTVDTVLWGRVTYQGMEQYWSAVPSNPKSSAHELEHAAWLGRTPKVVASRTLETVTWPNTTLIRDDLAGAVRHLKQQPGRDIVILGSPALTHALTDLGLVDEYRVNVNPVVLGGGTPLFKHQARMTLELLASRTFDAGVVGLHYRVTSRRP